MLGKTMETGRLKILVIAPTPFFSDRGTHIRILEEALALERRGHQVTIATYHIGAELPRSLGTAIDVRRIRRLLFWYRKLEAGPDWQKILLDLMLIRKAFNLARTGRPDIIHSHLHEGLAIGWVVRTLLFWRRMRLVADFHGSLTKEMTSHAYLRLPGLRFLFGRLERWLDGLGDAAVASSWDNAEEIGRIRQGRAVSVLLDGTRPEMFTGLPSRDVLRKKYGIPPGRVLIAYTGALIPNKGIRFLLGAIPLVCARYPEAHFVIAGYPLDQIAGRLGQESLRGRVTTVAPLPYFDLPGVLSMSDIAVDPKSAEVRQASGKLLNYMGAGLPVACFDTANNRRYLGAEAAFADQPTPEALAEAIGRLVRDPGLRERYGDAARKRASDFTWEKSAEQLETIYRGLLSGT